MPRAAPGPSAVVAEGNVRLKTMIDHLYGQYINQGLHMDGHPGVGTLVLPPSTREVLIYARFLAMETGDFARLFARHGEELAEGMSAGELYGLHSLVRGQGDAARHVGKLWASLGTDSEPILNDLVKWVTPPRLNQMLLYTRLVVEFQDRLLGSSTAGWEVTAPEWESILSSNTPPSRGRHKELVDKYRQGSFVVDAGRHLRALSLMHERHEGAEIMCTLVEDHIKKFRNAPAQNTKTLTMASYMAKYMVVDLSSFIKQYETLNLEFRPDFLQRRDMYYAICSKYFPGGKGPEERSAIRLLRDEPGLLAKISDDRREADLFMGMVHGEFFPRYLWPNEPTYNPDLAGINQSFERIRAQASQGVYGGHDERAPAARQAILGQIREALGGA